MKMRFFPALAFASIGVLAGIGGVTFVYAEGLSYLSNDAEVCVNCHIMRPQYDGWQKASHHASAACVDCHLPAGFPGKYITKAENGWNHSKAFTLQNFPEPISITPKNAEILQANCLRCHGAMLNELSIAFPEGAPRCVHCHQAVGHGEPVGLGGPMVADLEVMREEK